MATLGLDGRADKRHWTVEESQMSIRKMLSLHPDVAGHVNQPLGDAVHHAMYCAKMCLSCADACAAEKMGMIQCIRACLDCADICDATANVALRRTGSNEQVMRETRPRALQAVRADLPRMRRRLPQRSAEHRQLGGSNPPPNGEGDHPKDGGGAGAVESTPSSA